MEAHPLRIDWDAINQDWNDHMKAHPEDRNNQEWVDKYWAQYGGWKECFTQIPGTDRMLRNEFFGVPVPVDQESEEDRIDRDCVQMDYRVSIVDETLHLAILQNGHTNSTGLNALLTNLTTLTQTGRRHFMRTLNTSGFSTHHGTPKANKPYTIVASLKEYK